MAEDIKALIEKINQEGIRSAEEKARVIEAQARKEAKSILDKAAQEAERIISEAKGKCAQIEASTNANLKQASRDMLIALRKEISSMLERLVAKGIHQALAAEEMKKIILLLVKDYAPKEKGGIVISLNKSQLHELEHSLLSQLKDEARKGITLRPSEDIRAGFIISFDSGKSHYDFTDKSLADYIGSYVKPKLADLLKEAVS